MPSMTPRKCRRPISELAGSWDMSDEEAEKIKKGLKEGWTGF